MASRLTIAERYTPRVSASAKAGEGVRNVALGRFPPSCGAVTSCRNRNLVQVACVPAGWGALSYHMEDPL